VALIVDVLQTIVIAVVTATILTVIARAALNERGEKDSSSTEGESPSKYAPNAGSKFLLPGSGENDGGGDPENVIRPLAWRRHTREVEAFWSTWPILWRLLKRHIQSIRH
jgi:hypothetical protein